MEKATYHVTERDGAWSVRLNGKHFGPWPSRVAAVNAAIRAAAVAIENGLRAQVVVQQDNTLRTAWDSEKDARKPAPVRP
jgi:hypothetical protein